MVVDDDGVVALEEVLDGVEDDENRPEMNEIG